MKPILIIVAFFAFALSANAARPAKIYAVIIGESHYKDAALNKLKYCEDDAAAFADFLRSPQASTVPAENITFLTGTKATRSAVLKAAAELFTARAGEDDMIVFYFSGHGMSQGGSGYLMPYEGEESDPISSGIPMEQLYGIINASRAKVKTVYLDACHAGQFPHSSGAKGTVAEMNQEISRAFVDIIGKSQAGTLNVLSSKGSENSQESESLKAGLFTHYLILGLKGAADKKPSDGHVTAAELEEYLSQNVNNASGFKQHPIISRNLDAEFPLSILDLSLTLNDLISKQRVKTTLTNNVMDPSAALSVKPSNEKLSKGYYFEDRSGGRCYAKATFINNLGYPVTMYAYYDDNGSHDVSDLLSDRDQLSTGKLQIKKFLTLEQSPDQFFDCTFFFKATINGVAKYIRVKKTIESCYNQYFVLTPRNVQLLDQPF